MRGTFTLDNGTAIEADIILSDFGEPGGLHRWRGTARNIDRNSLMLLSKETRGERPVLMSLEDGRYGRVFLTPTDFIMGTATVEVDGALEHHG